MKHSQSQQIDIHTFNPKKDTVLLSQLIKLEKRLFPKSASFRAPGDLEQELKRRNTVLMYTDTLDGAVTGYIIFTMHGLVAHITKLLVVPEARRQGIGRQLVLAGMEAARKRRVGSITLHVDASNEPALGLYTGLGFVSETLLKDYYTLGRDAYKMRWELCEEA